MPFLTHHGHLGEGLKRCHVTDGGLALISFENTLSVLMLEGRLDDHQIKHRKKEKTVEMQSKQQSSIIININSARFEECQQEMEPAFIPLCKAIIRWMESEQDAKANKRLQNSWFKMLEVMNIAKPDYENGFIFFVPTFKNYAIVPTLLEAALWTVAECCEVEGMEDDEVHQFFTEMCQYLHKNCGGRILIRRKRI